MIKRFLAWLKSIYFKPAQAETQTPEVSIMSDVPVSDSQPAAGQIIAADGEVNIQAPVINITGSLSPAAEVKAGVADLDAALNFIESGVAQLGEAAKDELKELAKKYL